MKQALKYSKYLVKHGKVKQISATLFEVENHLVKFQAKKGRTLLLCDCKNNTSYCLENPICVHKVAVINFLMDKTFYKELDKLIELYSNWKSLKLPVTVDIMISDLKNLRNLK